MAIRIIQGGMGVGVSGWQLARAVSQLGHMGVASGTGLAAVVARRLGAGDEGGHMRRAMAHFPVPEMAQRIIDRYYTEGGQGRDDSFKAIPMPQVESTGALTELIIVSNFAEVWLAKEGHGGIVGVNYLEKLQTATLASLLGAMLADVDYILMGAGIPRYIPGALDALAEGKAVELHLDVEGAKPEEDFRCHLDPTAVLGMTPKLRRPKFLAIVSSVVLAMTLARKSNGHVDGFIVEGATAGGHNAPPRGPLKLNAQGEPIYGERDVVDLMKMKEIGLPFWLAGGFGEPGRLKDAIDAGAEGIQVGTAFAFCAESGITDELKEQALNLSRHGQAHVHTDPLASPTRFPFKVLELEGTLSDAGAYEERERLCDLGYLRQLYRKEDGTVGYRCAAEPEDVYVSKGGKVEDAVGRKCLCNCLLATIGLGQTRHDGYTELAMVTAGDEAVHLSKLLRNGSNRYTARDVVEYLLS